MNSFLGNKRAQRITLYHHILNIFLLWLIGLNFNFQAISVLELQMLDTTQTSEFTVHHNSHSSAKSLSFFHRMGGQDYRTFLSFSRHPIDHIPHKTSSFGVHSRWRFVQKYHFRVAKHGDSHRKFSLITSWQVFRQNIFVLIEI